MNIYNALITKFNEIQFKFDDFNSFLLSKITLKSNGTFVKINEYKISGNTVCLCVDNINIKENYYVCYDSMTIKCSYFKLFSTKEFNDKYAYHGKLGAIYSKEKTTFRVWSPGASNINLLLYKTEDSKSSEAPTSIKLNETRGLWEITLKGDFNMFYYTYEVTIYNETKEVVDPYAKAVGINGLKGAIIDLSVTNPPNWNEDTSPRNIKSFTDAILYEMNIYDISINPNSGISHAGKYLGLCEENSKTANNVPTGITYLKDLGVTHVQIMPIFDFSYRSVDEENPSTYNWGYDPQNYNVPEGIYATNPYDPKCRIFELKTLIKTLHKNGICVNMDVVFNHLWNSKENSFEKLFPEYYLRRNDDNGFSNGSGCGNDTASENYMFQKFIMDSIRYWIKEYHIDGFRFDLMGLHDTDTMNKIREELSKIDKTIMLYGEGWDLNTSLPQDKKAIISNSSKMPKIGYFNDVIRDALKGSVFNISDTGFISGKPNLEEKILYTSLGGTFNTFSFSKMFLSPNQSINYISCHDGNTLYDKLCASNPQDNEVIRTDRIKFALGIILTSQGIPFLQCGVEFARTKNGIGNSFNAPKEINWIDWERRDKYESLVNYVKGLIAFRKSHPALRFTSTYQLKEHIQVLNNMPPNSVGYVLKNHANNDNLNDIMIIYNANINPIEIPLKSSWDVCINKYTAGNSNLGKVSEKYTAEGLSVNILYRDKSFNLKSIF
ncbi:MULTISPECIES: type I pullulanase [Clostridium]|uniref:type I pullulanase n=1 Tax=Clostridium TaxID=1485 RepID=UPI000824DD2D|nr:MULTISPECIES: type I pullulanase [Clostridium]PJI09429.1 type I pullulanase [Clostridium sp. CT7]